MKSLRYFRKKMIHILTVCTILFCFNNCRAVFAEEVDIDAETMYASVLQEKLFADTDNSEEKAEGYDILNGLWEVGAVDYDYRNNPGINMIVDLADSDELADLYDGFFLSFYADGTFVYANPIFHEGTYRVHPQNPEAFILKTEQCYRLTMEDGEVTKVENDSKPSYYVEICDDTLHFQDYDPFTGKAKANDNGYYFVQIADESSFIQENKAELEWKKPGETESNGESYGSTSSYAGILEMYTQKMKDAVPGLVREYENESAGVTDIMELAEICNDKVGDLAEICNEGVGKMADLMYKKGDSYDTYNGWAEKLLNNYTDIAQEIQEAYLDSEW